MVKALLIPGHYEEMSKRKYQTIFLLCYLISIDTSVIFLQIMPLRVAFLPQPLLSVFSVKIIVESSKSIIFSMLVLKCVRAKSPKELA